MCGGQEMRDESERHILTVKVFTPRLTSSGAPHKMKKNTFWYFKNRKSTSASGHDRLLMMDLFSWQNNYETEQNIQNTLLYEGYWNSQKILKSWCFRHWAGSTRFWSLSKETHVMSPTVALAFCWSLFWSWHRMVELKLMLILVSSGGRHWNSRLLK